MANCMLCNQVCTGSGEEIICDSCYPIAFANDSPPGSPLKRKSARRELFPSDIETMQGSPADMQAIHTETKEEKHHHCFGCFSDDTVHGPVDSIIYGQNYDSEEGKNLWKGKYYCDGHFQDIQREEAPIQGKKRLRKKMDLEDAKEPTIDCLLTADLDAIVAKYPMTIQDPPARTPINSNEFTEKLVEVEAEEEEDGDEEEEEEESCLDIDTDPDKDLFSQVCATLLDTRNCLHDLNDTLKTIQIGISEGFLLVAQTMQSMDDHFGQMVAKRKRLNEDKETKQKKKKGRIVGTYKCEDCGMARLAESCWYCSYKKMPLADLAADGVGPTPPKGKRLKKGAAVPSDVKADKQEE